MAIDNDTEKLIVNHQRRLQRLRELQAVEGRTTDPKILNEIEDIEKKIAELRRVSTSSDGIALPPKSSDTSVSKQHQEQPTSKSETPVEEIGKKEFSEALKESMPGGNQISQRQNKKPFLEYLAAQRQLYNEEKWGLAVWTGITIAVAILGAGVLAVFLPFTPYITFVALLLVFSEFLVFSLIKKRGQEAAKIQELFDCELFELHWNDILTDKPKTDTILAAVDRFEKQKESKTAWEKLRNWYTPPNLKNLSLPQARIACQKENIWWDSKQRREYSRWVYLATGLFIALILLIGIIANWSFQQFFQGPLLLALPVFSMGLKLGYEHQKAAERLDELHLLVESLTKDASQVTTNLDMITQRTRQLQDAIYHHRMEDPPIPSWYYELRKKVFERFVANSEANNN